MEIIKDKIEDFMFEIDSRSEDYDLKLFLQDFVNFRVSYFRKNPELVRMLLWQRLEPIEKNISFNMQSSLKKKLELIIQDLQEKKQVRSDIPVEMIISYLMSGVSSSDFEFKNNLYKTQEQWEMYKRFIIDCLYKSLSS